MIVDEPKTAFSVEQMKPLFETVGAATSVAILNNTEKIIDTIKRPPVPTYCLYGYGTKTEQTYRYPRLLNDKVIQPHTIEYGNGDGVVPLLSLLQCAQWDEQAPAQHSIRCKECKFNSSSLVCLSNCFSFFLQKIQMICWVIKI